MMPSRCRRVPSRRAPSMAQRKAGLSSKVPSSMAFSMRSRSEGTMRPAPRCRCPTSELPTVLPGRPGTVLGSPTASPAASMVRFGHERCRASITGVSASRIRFPHASSRAPHPSRMSRATRDGLPGSRSSSDVPVMACGWSTPSRSSTVGATSTSVPASRTPTPSRCGATSTNGTGLSVCPVSMVPSS